MKLYKTTMLLAAIGLLAPGTAWAQRVPTVGLPRTLGEVQRARYPYYQMAQRGGQVTQAGFHAHAAGGGGFGAGCSGCGSGCSSGCTDCGALWGGDSYCGAGSCGHGACGRPGLSPCRPAVRPHGCILRELVCDVKHVVGGGVRCILGCLAPCPGACTTCGEFSCDGRCDVGWDDCQECAGCAAGGAMYQGPAGGMPVPQPAYDEEINPFQDEPTPARQAPQTRTMRPMRGVSPAAGNAPLPGGGRQGVRRTSYEAAPYSGSPLPYSSGTGRTAIGTGVSAAQPMPLRFR